LEIRAAELQRLYSDWCAWRGNRAFPSRQDFDAPSLKYLLGRINLIDVLHQPLRFRWRLHGSEVARRVGRDLTGRFLHDVERPDFRELTQREYGATVDHRTPQCFVHEGLLDDRVFDYEMLVLPLSDDGTEINMLLVGFNYGPLRSQGNGR
jgi:hypothetical protein